MYPPPLGMRGVPITDIIDIEEAGFFLVHSDRRFGKTVSCLRCSQNGVYGKGKEINLLLPICGDDVGRMRWHKQLMDGGTTIERVYDFIYHLLNDFAQNLLADHLCSQWIISACTKTLILNALLNSGHRYVFRAPFWPVDGAVEYVFNSIQSKLRIYFNRLETMDNLRNRINLAVGGTHSFHRYFEHVGFPVPA